jgi:hypothetical protein
MNMASELSELLERVKAATGPDKILDRDILCVIDGWAYEKRARDRQPWMYGPKGERRDPPGVGVFGAPRCSASIDAALALTERMLPEANRRGVEQEADGWSAYVSRNGVKSGHWLVESIGKTAPLAILAALLSALIAQVQP